MFDFSFGEMLIVGLVALVVLGPERLPKAARFVGLWVRRARAQWYSVKSELEREMATEDLRRGLADGQQAMREAEAQLRATEADIRSAVPDPVAEVPAPMLAADAPASGQPAEDSTQILAEQPIEMPRQDPHGQ